MVIVHGKRDNIILFLTVVFRVISWAEACNSTCGFSRTVPYPFGFSGDCKVPLICGIDEIRIGEFVVRNLTRDSILVQFPPKCPREIGDIVKLNGTNFAPTKRNGLLLQGCDSKLIDCVIPMNMIDSMIKSSNCSGNNSTICYSRQYSRDSQFMNLTDFIDLGCTELLSSFTVDYVGSGDRNQSSSSLLSLALETVELGWWVNGPCRCDSNADCVNVTMDGEPRGFRCNCKEGFDGDGFTDGEGCRRVPSCNSSNYMSGDCGGTSRIGVLIGGIVAGASLMSTMALICYCIRKRSAIRNQLSARRLVSEAAGSFSVPVYPYREIEKATNAFSEKQRLGTGAYGTVYAGKLYNNEWVAVKKIRHRDTDGIEQVMNEIKLLSSVSHPNLVRLLGCCIEKGEQILVYEYMPNGTLSQHLQKERGKGLPWAVRLTIATETAHAIAHLHSAMNPPIYHRDIKSSNILLNYNFNSKVADFGLSRLGMPDDSHISTAPQGTPGYVDPQYHQNFHLSDKSDVYSFGVVLVEIISALKVVDFSRPHSEINLASLAIDRIGKGRVDEIIDPFLEPNRDAWTLSSIHKVAELAFRCLAFHRDMRPSMMEVADELEQIRLSSWTPIDENTGMTSSVASSCSSPYNGSEKSVGGTILKKVIGLSSRRLVVPHRTADNLTKMEEVKESSPVSVRDPWLSEQSSPSTNSLLGNVGIR